jgi:hypothetical protein
MHEWNLRAGLRNYSLSVTRDPKSGRDFIRVDGRVAAKPMAPEESERVVTVGTSDYLLLRNEDGGMDLELLSRVTLDDEEFTERGEMAGRNLFRAAVLVVAFAIASLAYLAYGWASRLSAEWSQYEVADTILTGLFPGVPNESAARFRVDNAARHGRKLALRQGDHEYILSWIEYPEAESATEVWPPILELVGELTGPLKADVTREERVSLSGNPAISFTAATSSREWHLEGATLRGLVSRRAGSLYVAMVIHPGRDHMTLEASRFLRSVRLAAPEILGDVIQQP